MPLLQIPLSDGTMMAQELAGILTVGRNPDNALALDDGSVSSHHAKIDAGIGGVFVTDLFSSNGTYVNGAKVMTQKLEDGDQVRFGNVYCIFSAAGA